MRVLILSCNTGEGHNSCSAAIQECFEAQGVHCEVADALRFISKGASELFARAHVAMYRHFPALFRYSYSFLENHPGAFRKKSPIHRFFSVGTRRLGDHIRAGGFNAVICTHVFSAMILTETLRRSPLPVRTAFVATDYTCSPTVGACTPDICVIPHEELTEEFVACGIDRESILPAGIPVRRVFREQGDRAAARKALGLPAEGRHIVLMSGSIGCGPMGDVAEELDIRLEKGDFASVLCGSNKQMRYALELRHLCRVEAVGFTTQVALYMDSADVLVSKPGGISITEAGTRGVPLLLADMVGGCETRNQEFFNAHGWAESCPPADMAAAALKLLPDEKRRQDVVSAQHRDFDGLAAERIAEAVLARCGK